MVSSRHYKEYPLMKKQDIERAHTGFIAGSVCSSATKQNFTSYNYPVGPWILCCEDKKSQKSMKTWGGNVTRALRRGDQDSRLRALLLVFDSVSEANLRCHIKHILSLLLLGNRATANLPCWLLCNFVLSCFYCIGFLCSGEHLGYTLYP